MTEGEEMKRLRQEKGMLQKDLADLIGVTKETISHWETDKKKPSALHMIALRNAIGFGKTVRRIDLLARMIEEDEVMRTAAAHCPQEYGLSEGGCKGGSCYACWMEEG